MEKSYNKIQEELYRIIKRNEPKTFSEIGSTVDSLHYEMFGHPKTGRGYKYSKTTSNLSRLVIEGYVIKKSEVLLDTSWWYYETTSKKLCKVVDMSERESMYIGDEKSCKEFIKQEINEQEPSHTKSEYKMLIEKV